MASEDSQFVATGPIGTASDPDFAAFSTGWTNPEFDYGANVQGKLCGVYASAFHGGDRSLPQDLPRGIGVCALGFGTGVFGESQDSGVGVWGKASVRRGEGVRGFGAVGVVGVTEPLGKRERGFRAGVLGVVDGEQNPRPSELAERAGDAAVAGVGSGDGIGVLGIGHDGPAMEGDSSVGVGGRFRSGRRAQVHLLPTLGDLPFQGTAGELLSIADNPDSPDPEASLWFCTRGSDPNRPAEWKQLA